MTFAPTTAPMNPLGRWAPMIAVGVAVVAVTAVVATWLTLTAKPAIVGRAPAGQAVTASLNEPATVVVAASESASLSCVVARAHGGDDRVALPPGGGPFELEGRQWHPRVLIPGLKPGESVTCTGPSSSVDVLLTVNTAERTLPVAIAGWVGVALGCLMVPLAFRLRRRS